jgi:hypothetical protein
MSPNRNGGNKASDFASSSLVPSSEIIASRARHSSSRRSSGVSWKSADAASNSARWLCREFLSGISLGYDRRQQSWRTSAMIDFKGRHFERDVILWGIPWYVAYPMSYHQLEEMMEERGSRSTIPRSIAGSSSRLWCKFKEWPVRWSSSLQRYQAARTAFQISGAVFPSALTLLNAN